MPIHKCPYFILSGNGTEFKNQLIDNVLQQLGIYCIFSILYHPQSTGKLEVFHKYPKPTLNKLCKRIWTIGTNTSTKYWPATV